jgi:hypothetical protein
MVTWASAQLGTGCQAGRDLIFKCPCPLGQLQRVAVH